VANAIQQLNAKILNVQFFYFQPSYLLLGVIISTILFEIAFDSRSVQALPAPGNSSDSKYYFHESKDYKLVLINEEY